jgi:DNA mismatch repair protein MutS2
MQPATLRALEFDRIATAVRTYALTPLGSDALEALTPAHDPRRVAHLLDLTTEAVAFLHQHTGGLPFRAAEELETTLTALAVQGRPLEPLRLRTLADFLESVDRATALLTRQGADRWPTLAGVARGAASFSDEVADIRRKISDAGEVVDDASDALKNIRGRLRRLRSRLRSTLESYLRGRDTARYLQELIVTERNGRYVLVVKAEHRNAIPGLLHGTSASGASLFLEPLSTVEVNNEIVALEEEEAEEVRRILLELTDRLRARPLELQRTLEVVAELDAVQAKARFAIDTNCVRPEVSGDGRLELRGARHPLLIPAVRRRLESVPNPQSPVSSRLRPSEEQGPGARSPEPGDRRLEPGDRSTPSPVPVDVVVIPPTHVLIITGPNTGGKTVALKTAGLLALMAQAGLLIPAEQGSRLPTFRSVFADIGDEQSIATNLSTFSWHVTNVAEMDRALARPALVLLDEVGAGTDPAEGGPLGVAVVDHFRARGALVIATTHYDALKAYGTTTPEAMCAAFGFEPETFAPTYRLLYGSPGASLALEIAGRLGLDARIIDAARAQSGGDEAKLAERLAQLDRDLQAVDHERRLAARAREQAEAHEAQLRGREESLREREAVLRRKLDALVDERLRDARREIDRVVDDLKKKVADLEAEARRRAGPRTIVSTGDVGALRQEARARLESATEDTRLPQPEAADEPPGVPTRPSPGDRVTVGPFKVEGLVRAVFHREAEVDVHGKRLRVPFEELRVLGRSATPPPAARVSINTEPPANLTGDLNVIGCTVDEAISRADKFLDQAIVAEQKTVRLIHGHGKGRLRDGLAAFLAAHPQVLRFSLAPPDQGGQGVTVVELKE